MHSAQVKELSDSSQKKPVLNEGGGFTVGPVT